MKVASACAFLLVAASAAVVDGDDFTEFIGEFSGDNSWFDASLWPEHPDFPSAGDVVRLDTDDTYANIDIGNVESLSSLTVAQTASNVELEIGESKTLSVDTNVVIGENTGSSGKISLNTGANLYVIGDLTIGGMGTGTLKTFAGIVTVGGALNIGANGVVDMTAGKLDLQGDQLDVVHAYLHTTGRMIPNDGMATYAIYDVSKQHTIVYGPPDNGGGGVVRSFGCPASGEIVLTYEEGDTLELSPSAFLCTLVEIDSDAYTSGASNIYLKPVARSYSGSSWEAYSGTFETLELDCSGGSCRSSPPVPAAGRVFLLKTYSPPSYTNDDVSARFLEKGTFGPTRYEIASFNSAEAWVSEQVEMEMITSHRAFYRERLTHWHAESTYHNLLSTNPCQKGARYRRYAFLATDRDRYLQIETSSMDPSKTILSVDGMTRTVVDGPAQCGGSSAIDHDLTDGEYQICNFADMEGVHTEVRFRPCSSCGCDCDLWVNGIYGNPPVQFDEDHPPPMSVELGSNFEFVLNDRFEYSDFENNIIQLSSPISDSNCSEVVPGAPETVFVGTIVNGAGKVEYWMHSTSLMVVNNTIQKPLEDGGKSAMNQTASVAAERQRAVCSNAPRTFLNEDNCILSDSACFSEEGPDVDIEISLENLEKMHSATGGTGGPETKYVYAVQGLRNDPAEDLDTPCTPGARSRWIPTIDCTGGPLVGSATKSAIETLLFTSSDRQNPYMRDIFFPLTGLACNPNDTAFDYKVEVEGICWENVHPDHLQVYAFNYWRDNHNGGAFKIIQFADVQNTWILTFPGWHEMWRWNENVVNFPNVGRLGDSTTLKSLPDELIREDIAQAFGLDSRSVAATGSVMACGSPFEVASVHDLESGPRVLGGFDMETEYNTTTADSRLREQRRAIWVDIALKAPDQLRQRMAHALSQILVVSPGAIQDDDYTESFLSYYDIFVRHAFGNYFDVLKEVTYHPLMAEMLTYIGGESTGYAWIARGIVQKADENYAREIMQLFSIGLYHLHPNGTQKMDSSGNEMHTTYTNKDITEYAKVYVGFVRQGLRGNIEDPRNPGQSGDNQIDPVVIDAEEKDHLPKLGLDVKYIGDGYPLCIELPSQHFLKAGAKYRLLGSNPKPDLLFEEQQWEGAAPKRLSLNASASNLAELLCNGDTNNCRPVNATFTLQENVDCVGKECEVQEPRTLQVAPGIWYEYVRPPCVKHSFFDNPQSIRRRRGVGRYMCGNPASLDAAVVCCNSTRNSERRNELFGGERVPLSTADSRCTSMPQYGLCEDASLQATECADPLQGGCDYNNVFYWLRDPCTLAVKIDPEGSIAVVHQHGLSGRSNNDNYRMVRSDTKTYFRADWESEQDLDVFLENYSSNCVAIGCIIDSGDGLCQCSVAVESSSLFQSDNDLISIQNIIEKATIGAFTSDGNGEPVSGIVDTVTKYPPGPLSQSTVFEFVDSYGQTQLRKNVLSMVSIGDGSLKIRNPVGFFSISEFNERDARYELDATLEHYFYHPNTAPFISVRLAQRFGISNPSPRYVEAIALAFTTGDYQGIGSGKYGCLKATIAAILLDPESSNPILDADPAHGSLLEPYLKLIKIMRSLGLKTAASAPFLRFEKDLQDLIGQEAHKTPSVFSFFLPEYRPAGRVSSAHLVSPESQVLNGPQGINLLKILISTIKYGLTECFGGLSSYMIDKDGWAATKCEIGTTTNYGTLTYNASGLNFNTAEEVVSDLATLLTGGRLTSSSRQAIINAFDDTISALNGLEEAVRPSPELTFFEAVVNVQQLIAMSPEFHTTNIPSQSGDTRSLPSARMAPTSPYQAITFLMLAGGADSFNILVPAPGACGGGNQTMPVDEQYSFYRDVLAFDASLGEYDLTISAVDQPCTQFAIHDELDVLHQLYNDGDAIFFANSGVVNQNAMTRSDFSRKTRTQLFAHNAMQEETKKVDPYDNIDGTGALGRAKDVLEAKGFNMDAINIDLSSVLLSGSPGVSTAPFVVSRNGASALGERPEKDLRSWRLLRGEEYFDVEGYASMLNAEVDGFSGIFADQWSDTIINGMQGAGALKYDIEVLSNSSDAIWESDEPFQGSSLADSLKVVSELMQTHESRKTNRDAFYVEFGGFDHHNALKENLRPKMSELNANLGRFVSQLKMNGQWNTTAIYITSEFARTITPNSNAGSDHAWGQHTILIGGAVKGGQILGMYPDDISPDSPLADGSGRGRFIPTTSNDAIWNGILSWFGASESDLDYCLPNRANTVNPYLGSSSPLFNQEDLFE